MISKADHQEGRARWLEGLYAGGCQGCGSGHLSITPAPPGVYVDVSCVDPTKTHNEGPADDPNNACRGCGWSERRTFPDANDRQNSA